MIETNVDRLKERASYLIQKSVAPATEKKYASCVNVFQTFCNNTATIPFPLTEQSLILFATSLSISMSHKSINAHIAAVKYHAHVLGHDLDITPFARLYSVRPTECGSNLFFELLPGKCISPQFFLPNHKFP